MWQIVFFTLGCDLLLAAAYNNFRKSVDSTGRKQYQVQHGPCSYTFLLPEMDSCRSASSPYVSNAVQRDAPLDYDDSTQRLQVLESMLENNTQWLMKVGDQGFTGECWGPLWVSSALPRTPGGMGQLLAPLTEGLLHWFSPGVKGKELPVSHRSRAR